MARPVPGLSDPESRAWVAIMTLCQMLTPALDGRLRVFELTNYELGILISLTEAPERTRTISRIADILHSTLPRMSKAVTRLEARNLVERAASSHDARASSVTITPQGRQLVKRAMPVYVDEARGLLLDRLAPEQVERLADILEPLVLELDPHGPVGR